MRRGRSLVPPCGRCGYRFGNAAELAAGCPECAVEPEPEVDTTGVPPAVVEAIKSFADELEERTQRAMKEFYDRIGKPDAP